MTPEQADDYARKKLIISGELMLHIVGILGEQPYHKVAPILTAISTLEEKEESLVLRTEH